MGAQRLPELLGSPLRKSALIWETSIETRPTDNWGEWWGVLRALIPDQALWRRAV